jgi:hypothetical protein
VPDRAIKQAKAREDRKIKKQNRRWSTMSDDNKNNKRIGV